MLLCAVLRTSPSCLKRSLFILFTQHPHAWSRVRTIRSNWAHASNWKPRFKSNSKKQKTAVFCCSFVRFERCMPFLPSVCSKIQINGQETFLRLQSMQLGGNGIVYCNVVLFTLVWFIVPRCRLLGGVACTFVRDNSADQNCLFSLPPPFICCNSVDKNMFPSTHQGDQQTKSLCFT